MRKIIPQIYTENCKEALEFYESAFGGEIQNVKTADSNEIFNGDKNQIVHSELHINDDCILYMYSGIKNEDSNITLLLQLESEDEISKIYDYFGADGNVKVKLDKQFCGDYHGVVTDKYGVTWGLNYSPNK